MHGDHSLPGAPATSLPQFDVRLEPPDLGPFLAGNTGVPGFTTRVSPRPGPHVALLALTHGNEIAGAIVLERLLRAGIAPTRGRLTFGFINLMAFERFDPRQPTASRFADEDLNRVWDRAVLDGPRQSQELTRAREIRPLIDTVDVVMDLHSMLWPSEPLILSGPTDKGRLLALAIGAPGLVIADRGHASGNRIIDYDRFTDPAFDSVAVLVEAGQHWEQATVQTTSDAVCGLLHHLDMAEPHQLLPQPAPPRPPRFAEVTAAVTATTSSFAFVRAFRGGDVVEQRNTLIAIDGDQEIRTPYDRCMLVMPSLRPSRGHTAVRLARLEADDGASAAGAPST